MEEYTLFLDESETCNVNKITNIRENQMFVIAGIVCTKQYHDSILHNQIDFVKDKIWNRCGQDKFYSQKVLHELEMSRAINKKYKQLKNDYNKVFKNKHIYNFTYDMLTEIIRNGELVILSVCIDEDNIGRYYDRDKINDRFQIAMNMIIENYYHFLNHVNGIGDICYESLPENQNQRIMKRYQGIRYNGTMFYPAKVINERIKGLEFKNKTQNIAGLQLADFIPNAIGRSILHKKYTNNKERNISYSVIESKLYDGGIDCTTRYGSKIIP